MARRRVTRTEKTVTGTSSHSAIQARAACPRLNNAATRDIERRDRKYRVDGTAAAKPTSTWFGVRNGQEN